MKRNFLLLAFPILASSLPAAENAMPGDQMLADYFRSETAALAERCLADIQSLEDWKSKRQEYRRQLQEMLGLWPMPERTDLKAVVTGKIERDEFIVEKLHFQASPKLYVTANLHLPKQLERPAPAILYVCGHSRVFSNGISYGNKVGYQHHGAWFARNGYVCLTIDTLQLGEIEGLHHGTHREGMWWWNSRGYTPAGVEAWFGIRALDYLCSRPEVDKERIGMTGRSGGGSYTWTVAALDDRVKVAAPVAGITDLQNQVVDGCVEGHCDCMFFVNTYRWDFPQLAALLAPRPLLIANSDKDNIFPLDGVVRLHDKVRRIYQLHGAEKNLGLLITEGPHSDTQDLQLPVFRWFNRFLKGEQPLIEMAAKKLLQAAQLRVFDKLPADAVNTNIHSQFVPIAMPQSAGELKAKREVLLATLKEKTFGGWPAEDTPLNARRAFSVEHNGLEFSGWDFTSQPEVRLRLYFIESTAKPPAGGILQLNVLDEDGWRNWLGVVRAGFEGQLADELASANPPAAGAQGLAKFRALCETNQAALAFFAPRGIGVSTWSGDAKKQTQIRRRFMLLGQTLEGMRVWDIRRAVQMIHFVREGDTARIALGAARAMSSQVQLAAVYEPSVRALEVEIWRDSELGGADYLNLLKLLDADGLGRLNSLRSQRP
jgi:dienelactone hydrolase